MWKSITGETINESDDVLSLLWALRFDPVFAYQFREVNGMNIWHFFQLAQQHNGVSDTEQRLFNLQTISHFWAVSEKRRRMKNPQLEHRSIK